MRIVVDSPSSAEVRPLLEAHWRFAADHTEPDDVHALGVAELLDPSVTFFSGWSEGVPVAIGALKHIDETHYELKSMHSDAAVRRRGHGRAMLQYLLAVARRRGASRVSLETGSTEPFAAALALYRSAGFEDCEPFADYAPDRGNTFLTLVLTEQPP